MTTANDKLLGNLTQQVPVEETIAHLTYCYPVRQLIDLLAAACREQADAFPEDSEDGRRPWEKAVAVLEKVAQQIEV